MSTTKERILVALLTVGTFVVLYLMLASCASLKRTGWVAAGSMGGAGVGTLVGGPGVGTIAGAGVGGGVASALVDSDIVQGRNEKLEDRLYGAPRVPELQWPMRHPWWTLIGVVAIVVIWLKRAHLLDLLTGKNPRWDAILRTIGLRTHRSTKETV